MHACLQIQMFCRCNSDCDNWSCDVRLWRISFLLWWIFTDCPPVYFSVETVGHVLHAQASSCTVKTEDEEEKWLVSSSHHRCSRTITFPLSFSFFLWHQCLRIVFSSGSTSVPGFGSQLRSLRLKPSLDLLFVVNTLIVNILFGSPKGNCGFQWTFYVNFSFPTEQQWWFCVSLRAKCRLRCRDFTAKYDFLSSFCLSGMEMNFEVFYLMRFKLKPI